MTLEEIEAVAGDYESSSLLSDRDKAVVHWAEAVTIYQAPQDDEGFERLKQFFNEAEIIELTWTSALFNMVNRVHDSLQLDIEQQTEVDRIRRSSRVSEDAILSYVKQVLDYSREHEHKEV